MKKLKLSLETLRVETFEPAAREEAPRGTVHGRAGSSDGFDCINPCLPIPTPYPDSDTSCGYYYCDTDAACPNSGAWNCEPAFTVAAE